jgi:hypothetical protein
MESKTGQTACVDFFHFFVGVKTPLLGYSAASCIIIRRV